MADPELAIELRQARHGDREALNRLLARTHGRLTRLAQTRLGDALRARVTTSDLLQSTYFDVLRSVGEFEGDTEDAFVAWVGRILENNIRDKRRYFGAAKRTEDEGAAVEAVETALLSARGATPSAQVAYGEAILQVAEAFRELPEDYRRVLLLRSIEGRDAREVADALDRSEPATRVLLSRARAAFLLEWERVLKKTGGGAP